MADPQFSVEVTHNLQELVDRGVAAIVAATETMADELRSNLLPDEAPVGATGALSSQWQVREVDPLTVIVYPPADAWYAHIVAGGRTVSRPQGGTKALTIEGGFAAYATGTDPNPFHDRAVGRLERQAGALIEAALAEQGL